MKRALLTHDDFDGVACAVLAHSVWPDIDIYYCNYKNIDFTVNKILTFSQYNEIYITDITPSDKMCDLLNSCWEDKHDHLSTLGLFDHHETRASVKRFKWATFRNNKCGAKLFYGYLIQQHNIKSYYRFVELTDVYDRWLLDNPLREKSEQMETFRKAVGNKRFFDRFVENASVHLSKAEHLVYTIRLEQDNTYINNAKMFPYEIDGEKCYVSFGEKLASKICHKKINEGDIRLALNINMRHQTVELRSTSGFNVGELAAKHGGGGHAEAAGFSISEEQLREIMDILLRERKNG